jgi:hypothetical protein
MMILNGGGCGLRSSTNSVPLRYTVTGSPKHHCIVTGDDDFSRDLLRSRAGKDRVETAKRGFKFPCDTALLASARGDNSPYTHSDPSVIAAFRYLGVDLRLLWRLVARGFFDPLCWLPYETHHVG